MARGIPDEETAEPRVMPENMPRKVTPYLEEPPNVVGGFAAAADATARKYNADSATWAGDQIAQARVKAVQSLEAAQGAAPAGDQTGFTDKYLGAFDKDNGALAKSAGGNPVAQQMVEKGLTDLRQTLEQHSRLWEAQQNVAYRADSLQNNLKSQLPLVEAHPELAQQVGSTLMDQLNASGAEPSKRLPFARDMNAQISLAAANGLTRQDPQGMLKALNDPENAPAQFKGVLSGLNDQQREAVLGRAQGHISQNYSDSIVNAYRTQGPVAGAQALGAIDKLDQSDEIKASIRADTEKGLAQWHAEARETHAQDVMGLEERLAAGKPQPGDRGMALSLWKNGAFTPGQAAETAGRVDKAMEAQAEEEAARKAILGAYQNRQPLDPKDKDIQGGIGDLFTALTKGIQPGSAEWINRGADIAQRTGVAPEPMVSYARANLVSGAPQEAATAAQAIQRLEDATPRGVGYALDEREKTQAKIINDAVTAGTPAIQAVENARKIGEMSDAESKRLEERYKVNQNAFATGAPGALRNELSSFKPGFGITHPLGGSLPDVPPAMEGQFEQLQGDYYKTTGGNISQARDLAAADLKRTWGVSQVNGKPEFMQYAPEAMYPGLTPEFIRKDMAEVIAGLGPYDPAKVRLTESPKDTPTTQGRVWNMSVPDQFGAYDMVRGPDNQPYRYVLPDATDSVKATRDKLATEGMEKARTLAAKERVEHQAEWDALGGAAATEGRAPTMGY